MHIASAMKLQQAQQCMNQRNHKHRNPQVAAIVEYRKGFIGYTAERPDN